VDLISTKEATISYKCEVREQAAQPALSIRTRTSVENLPRIIGEAFGAIARYAADMGEQPAGPPYTAYYNMDMEDLDLEMGFPFSRKLQGKDEIQASQTPGGKVATCLYTGPYSDIGPAYDALSQWMNENGHESTGVAYEVYLNDPDHTPPQELRTQIAFLLKSA